MKYIRVLSGVKELKQYKNVLEMLKTTFSRKILNGVKFLNNCFSHLKYIS